MQNLYPLFERNRILKKELLWSLRDYSFSHIRLEYQKYSDGVLEGCDLTVGDGYITVGTGVVKHEGFIYLLTEETRVEYEPVEEYRYLKIHFRTDHASYDYIGYGWEIRLDQEEERGDNELELCRFKLKRGSILRSDYSDFYDLETEYDTVNLIHAAWAGIGKESISPAITRMFSVIVMEKEEINPIDFAFACQCLNVTKAVSRDVLDRYLNLRLECGSKKRESNQELFDDMLRVLNIIKGTSRPGRSAGSGRKRQIVVD